MALYTLDINTHNIAIKRYKDFAIYRMFILSSSNRRLYKFTTYLGPLKNCCPKFPHKLVCHKQPKTVQPALPTSQSCRKTNFKKTYYMIILRHRFQYPTKVSSENNVTYLGQYKPVAQNDLLIAILCAKISSVYKPYL
jgi:hypothetical protein